MHDIVHVYIRHEACVCYIKLYYRANFLFLSSQHPLLLCDMCTYIHDIVGSSPEKMASSGSNWRLLSVVLCTHRPTAVWWPTSSTHRNRLSSPSRRPSMTTWWVFTSGTASDNELVCRNYNRSTIGTIYCKSM